MRDVLRADDSGVKPGHAWWVTLNTARRFRYPDAMTTPVAERLITAEEFAGLPTPPGGGKMELLRGRVVTMPPVGPDHGERAVRLGASMVRFADEHAAGKVRAETGYWLAGNPDHVCAPDVSFVLAERLAAEQILHGAVTQPPDLAVEITSPGDRDRDVQEKVDDYLAAGVKRVWVVRPELKTVAVHRPGGDAHTYGIDDTLGSEDATFPVAGFALPLADLFRD